MAQFAEYRNLAPEPVPQSQGTALDKPEGGLESQPRLANLWVAGEHKKKVLGLAPRTAVALISIALLVVVGAVVGAVLGTKRQNQTATTTETPSQDPSSTESGMVAATPTALTIIEAIYGAANVTAHARPFIQQGPNIVVDMSDTAWWAGPDPWYGVFKCLALLHSYGPSIRTFIACEGDGTLTLVPGNTTESPHTQDITRQGPTNSQFAIVSIVWGDEEIRDGNVYNVLYEYKNNGSNMPFENSLFGKDPLPGVLKSGVIWYTEDNFLTFKGIFGREYINISF